MQSSLEKSGMVSKPLATHNLSDAKQEGSALTDSIRVRVRVSTH